MDIGVIGLGRMGGNIVRRLLLDGHRCVVFDHNKETTALIAQAGAAEAADMSDLIGQLAGPRVVWVMLPAGVITEQVISDLALVMQSGDIIIDGGNGFYKDDIRRAKMLRARGIDYVDIGTSGGIAGLERGYCMMVGGTEAAVAHIDPILKSLCPGSGTISRTRRPEGSDPKAEEGYIHAGSAGAGHFVKMVHNGIEYGLMQAYAEGFGILKGRASLHLPVDERFDLNLTDIAEVWRRGSVISSWLLDLTAQALAGDPRLDQFTGAVNDSGEGRWTLEAALEEDVPADVLAAALFARFRSRGTQVFSDKLLSAMRFGFGGHSESESPK